jgi:hypothetical protein
MPEAFWVGLIVVLVLVTMWIGGTVWLRLRRRGTNDRSGLLAPGDRAAARGELAGGRDGIAIGMALRGNQRQGF